MPTQDDIGLTTRSESAFVTPDANEVITEARRALRDVLPSPVHHEHEWAASLVHCHVHCMRVLQALKRHTATSASGAGEPIVGVRVQEHYLSVAGVIGLRADGAVATGDMPLHTGRYVQVTLSEEETVLASLWMPLVPVFRVSSRLVA